MSKYIAVKDCTLSLSIGQGDVKIDTEPSSIVKINDKGVYSGILNISISKYTGGTINVPETGSGKGTLTGTAIEVKLNGNGAVLEGDKATVIVNGKMNSNSGPVPAVPPVTETVTITNAGQNKVKGE